MPVPRTPNAPVFDGQSVSVSMFLQILVQHGANAEIAHLDDLVPYILRYSTESVKEVIQYMPEFDEDVPNKEWTRAKEALSMLYGSIDPVKKTTEEDLREYCRASYAKPAFANMQAVDAYHRGFQSLAAPLVKRGLLSPVERDFYFITGIPEPLRDWFFELVPESKRSRKSPPSVLESVSYLHERFDPDSILWSPWDKEPQSSHNNIPCPCSVNPHQHTSILTQFNELSQQVSDVVKRLNQEVESAKERSHQQERKCSRDRVNMFRRCFMCGKSGEELKHPLHPSRCTETQSLLSEGLILFNRSTARYTLTNGEELPNVRGFSGGVAAFLRAVDRAQSYIPSKVTVPVETQHAPQDQVWYNRAVDAHSEHHHINLHSISSFQHHPLPSSQPTHPMSNSFNNPEILPCPASLPQSDEEEEVDLPVYTSESDEQEEQVDNEQISIFDDIMNTVVPLTVSELVDVLSLQKSFLVAQVEESFKVSPLEPSYVFSFHCLSTDHEQKVYQVHFQIPKSPNQVYQPCLLCHGLVSGQVHEMVKQMFPWFFWWKNRDKELKSQVCRILRTEFKVSPSVVGWYDPLVNTPFPYPFSLIIICILILLTVFRI